MSKIFTKKIFTKPIFTKPIVVEPIFTDPDKKTRDRKIHPMPKSGNLIRYSQKYWDEIWVPDKKYSPLMLLLEFDCDEYGFCRAKYLLPSGETRITEWDFIKRFYEDYDVLDKS